MQKYVEDGVQLDHEKLEGIIYNLLSNAAKFTPTKGQVSFTATVKMADSSTCSLHLLVEDTGISIPSVQLSRIFERFYQVDISATRPYEGTGIGLALVKELVGLHGGMIEVQSTEGRGSTFHLHIPFTLAEAAEIPKENGTKLQSERGELNMENHGAASKEPTGKRDLPKKDSRYAYQKLVNILLQNAFIY